ncbi:hypothetical protein ACIBD9_22430 [Micromonospora sp. NPDC050784]|uniref:hypothetical protein n=1 Tax=Micromonospora sp. NPDC050784 TaxID=3364281 RepID=UPI0037898B86
MFSEQLCGGSLADGDERSWVAPATIVGVLALIVALLAFGRDVLDITAPLDAGGRSAPPTTATSSDFPAQLPTPVATTKAQETTPAPDPPVPTTERSTKKVTVAPAVPRPAYLADQPRLDPDTATVQEGKATIRGAEYFNSVYMCSELSNIPNIYCNSDESDPWYAEYTMPPRYKRFLTLVGLSDKSPSDCVSERNTPSMPACRLVHE